MQELPLEPHKEKDQSNGDGKAMTPNHVSRENSRPRSWSTVVLLACPLLHLLHGGHSSGHAGYSKSQGSHHEEEGGGR